MLLSEKSIARSQIETSRWSKNPQSIIGYVVNHKIIHAILDEIKKFLKENKKSSLQIVLQNNYVIVLFFAAIVKDDLSKNTNCSPFSFEMEKKMKLIRLTGYSINAILSGELIKISNDGLLVVQNFGKLEYWKPYKVSVLKVNKLNFTKMLKKFENHKFVFLISRNSSSIEISCNLFYILDNPVSRSFIAELIKSKMHSISPIVKGELIAFKKSEVLRGTVNYFENDNKLNLTLTELFDLFSLENEEIVQSTNFYKYKKYSFSLNKENISIQLEKKKIVEMESSLSPNLQKKIFSNMEYLNLISKLEKYQWRNLGLIKFGNWIYQKFSLFNVHLLLSNQISDHNNISELDHDYCEKGLNLRIHHIDQQYQVVRIFIVN